MRPAPIPQDLSPLGLAHLEGWSPAALCTGSPELFLSLSLWTHSGQEAGREALMWHSRLQLRWLHR